MSSLTNGADISQYYLQSGGAQLYLLSFCENVTLVEVYSNMHVVVTYSRMEAGVLYSCEAPKQSKDRRSLFGITITAPTAPSFLFYVPKFCGFESIHQPTSDVRIAGALLPLDYVVTSVCNSYIVNCST